MDILMGACEVPVRFCLAQSDLAGAERAVYDMERIYHSAEIPLFRSWIDSLRAEFWLAQGNLKQAAKRKGKPAMATTTRSNYVKP